MDIFPGQKEPVWQHKDYQRTYSVNNIVAHIASAAYDAAVSFFRKNPIRNHNGQQKKHICVFLL